MSGIALGIVGLFGPILVLIAVIGVCERMGWDPAKHWPGSGEDDG